MKLLIAALWLATLGAAGVLGHQLNAESRSESRSEMRGEPADRLSQALRDRDVLIRAYRVAEALQELDERDIDAAVAVLEQQRRGVTEGEVRLFMLAWCRFDPVGAFAWADAWPGPWRSTLVRKAIFAWAFRDPEGAAEAFGAMEPALRKELHAYWIGGWARSEDTAGLTEYLFSQPAGGERSRSIGVLLAELLDGGPEAVVRWAEDVPVEAPNQAKVTAFLTAGGALAQYDPGDATAFYEAHRQFDYAQPALKTIARRWVDNHEPELLFEWLFSLPPGEGVDDAVEAGFSRWWSRAPEDARAWLLAAPSTEALDPAVAVFARNLSRTSVRRAVGWAERIHDEPLQRRTLAPLLRQWGREDPAAARAWMNARDVPSKLQRELMNPSAAAGPSGEQGQSSDSIGGSRRLLGAGLVEAGDFGACPLGLGAIGTDDGVECLSRSRRLALAGEGPTELVLRTRGIRS
jgi:hypothetical protein